MYAYYMGSLTTDYQSAVGQAWHVGKRELHMISRAGNACGLRDSPGNCTQLDSPLM